MASTDDDVRLEAALRLIHNWAAAKRVRYGEQALFDARSLGFYEDDILLCLLDTNVACVSKIAADRDFPDRTVVVMRLPAEGKMLYVKVSLRIDQDHDVWVRSFHRA